jgi:hypothetical protein
MTVSIRWLLALFVMGACEREDPCETMCATARNLYGSCLDEWGASWTAAGYADGDEFEASCQTWAWQMRRLEKEARGRGEAEMGDVDQVCRVRAACLADSAATCDDFTDIDWDDTPW